MPSSESQMHDNNQSSRQGGNGVRSNRNGSASLFNLAETSVRPEKSPDNLTFVDLHPEVPDLTEQVIKGLKAPQKRTPALLFYDQTGSEIFERICETPEYYVTRKERAILQEQGASMAASVGQEVRVVEPGAGNVQKVGTLLAELQEPSCYTPIDISGEFLLESSARIAERFPDLPICAVCADYFRDNGLAEVLSSQANGSQGDVIFFPGSTIGNMEPAESVGLLRRLRSFLQKDAGLLIGVDLKKDEDTLVQAYSDEGGVTAEFNYNLLEVLNRRFGADFEPGRFQHEAHWNDAEGRMESHLRALEAHPVSVAGQEFHLEEGETIHTESSYKYTIEEFQELMRRTGFEPSAVWTDPEGMYSVHYGESLTH